MGDFSFFQTSPIPPEAMSGNYMPSLVILSYIIAILASYVALEIATSLREERVKSDIFLLSSGAFAMGSGIFTMHFIGMLAFIMPMSTEYDLTGTLLSLVVAIVASGSAFFLIKKPQIGKLRLILGGILLGLAIAGMHYTGMNSMLRVKITYVPGLFFLSLVIAIGASIAALWCMLRCEKEKGNRRSIFKISSAILMGIGICGMHYIGMAAAVFLPFEEMRGGYFLSPVKLAILIAYIASLTMIVTLLFNSYRHLILVKLLLGYITIILLTIPMAIIPIGIIKEIDRSLETTQNLNELIQLQERIQLFGQETLIICFLIIGITILFSIILSAILSLQFSNSISLLRDSAEKVAKGDLKQHIDILSKDELGQLGQSFNQMVQSLAKLKKEGEKFMSIAAHDLRHPLSVIMQASSLIESEIQSKKIDNQDKLLKMINQASSSMLSLINELLIIRSFESLVFQITKKKVNIHLFSQSIFEFNELLANKKNIHFDLKIEIVKDFYYFDEEKIAQVINNLLSNAFKFSKPNSHILLFIKGDHSVLRFEVHDEAGGIPENEQNQVFSKFSKISVKPTSGEASHGLGLAICQDLIQAHGGKIGFNSSWGKGSTFYFEIDG